MVFDAATQVLVVVQLTRLPIRVSGHSRLCFRSRVRASPAMCTGGDRAWRRLIKEGLAYGSMLRLRGAFRLPVCPSSSLTLHACPFYVVKRLERLHLIFTERPSIRTYIVSVPWNIRVFNAGLPSGSKSRAALPQPRPLHMTGSN